ncbi:MAG: GH25 family lysozyme [Bacilli bacterium]|nr:GH25 family lysozyme [Bacilli bacterium]
MNKKKIIITTIVIVLLVLLSIGIYAGYNYYRIVNAKIIVIVKPNYKIEVFDKVHVKDLIVSINGKLVKNELVDTTEVGTHELEFEFINEDNIRVKYSLEYTVKDNTPPIIGVPSSTSVTVGYDKDLSNRFFCGDNYDDEPKCIVEGDYDVNTVGTYYLNYKATDSSNNETSQKFTLYVKEKVKQSPSTDDNTMLDVKSIIEKHKNKNTKIGIDISRWQGKIDYKQVKESGIEFVMIRVGSENAEGKFFVDPMFEEYIEGFNEVGIPVGIYYYSYADTIEHAKKEAKWVIKQIKKYKVDLQVVYDWENWNNYYEFKVSFHHLSEIANTFLSTVEEAGYEGMLYSSKYYLENIWEKPKYKVWLAHYTEQTTYEGEYMIWQLCDNGYVPGVNENQVDLNIMYVK